MAIAVHTPAIFPLPIMAAGVEKKIPAALAEQSGCGRKDTDQLLKAGLESAAPRQYQQ